MAKKFLIHCTAGREDPERAILPFIMADVAVSSDQEAIVFLTLEGVRVATKGYAADVKKEGFKPLEQVMSSFLANGGQIWACGACTNPRGIKQDDMIEGAKIVTAANLVEVIASGAVPVNVT
jgi:uncharacterized protein